MFTIKVGVMPGRLQEVAVNEGMSAREIFELADVTVSNHEVRLDGDVINIDDNLDGGKLLVAMKQIKGNARTIKVGTMPGKLQEVEITGNETARELFERAGITISNHEIRLDGNIVDIDSTVENGNLLVSMKQIKGNGDTYAENSSEYVTDLSEIEVEILLQTKLPTVISASDIEILGDSVLIQNTYLVDKDMFFSVFEEGEVKAMQEDNEDDFIRQFRTVLAKEDEFAEMTKQIPVQEEHVCTCKNAVDVVEHKIKTIQEDLNYYEEVATRKRAELYVLQDVLKDIR